MEANTVVDLKRGNSMKIKHLSLFAEISRIDVDGASSNLRLFLSRKFYSFLFPSGIPAQPFLVDLQVLGSNFGTILETF